MSDKRDPEPSSEVEPPVGGSWFARTPKHSQVIVFAVPLLVVVSLVAGVALALRQAGRFAQNYLGEKQGIFIEYESVGLGFSPFLALRLSGVDVKKMGPKELPGGQQERGPDLGEGLFLKFSHLDFQLDLRALWDRELRVAGLVLRDVDLRLRASPAIAEPSSSAAEPVDDESSSAEGSSAQPSGEATKKEKTQGSGPPPAEPELPLFVALAKTLDQVWEQLPGFLEVQGLTIENAVFRSETVEPSPGEKATRVVAFTEAAFDGEVHLELSVDPATRAFRTAVHIPNGAVVSARLKKEAVAGEAAAPATYLELDTQLSAEVSLSLLTETEQMGFHSLGLEKLSFETAELQAKQEQSLPAGSVSTEASLKHLHVALESPTPSGVCHITLSPATVQGEETEPNHRTTVQPCYLVVHGAGIAAQLPGKEGSSGLGIQELGASLQLKLEKSFSLTDHQASTLSNLELPELAAELSLSRKAAAAAPATTLLTHRLSIQSQTSSPPRVLVSADVDAWPDPLLQFAETSLPGLRTSLQGMEPHRPLLKHSRLQSQFELQLQRAALDEVLTSEGLDVARALRKARPVVSTEVRFTRDLRRGKQADFVVLTTVARHSPRESRVDVRFNSRLRQKVAGVPLRYAGGSARLQAVVKTGSNTLVARGPLIRHAQSLADFSSFGVGALDQARVRFETEFAGVDLDSEALPAAKPAAFFHRFSARTDAELMPNGEAHLHDLQALAVKRGQEEEFLDLQMQGKVNPSLSKGSLEGQFHLSAEEETTLELDSPVSLQGELRLPIAVYLSLRDRKALRLRSQAEAELTGFSFESSALQVKELTGRLPLDQQIVVVAEKDLFAVPQPGSTSTSAPEENSSAEGDDLSSVRLAWEPLLEENPFRRADSRKLTGLYSAAQNLSVEQVVLKGEPSAATPEGSVRSFGPFAASIALKQNQLILDSFDGSAFGGQLTGHMLVNVNPRGPSVGFNGRMTGLNGAEVLQLEGLSAEDARLSARAAVEYSFARSAVEGRVDVAAVPRPLMEALVQRADPSGADSKIAAVRRGLSVARPGRMGLLLHDGVADVTLELISPVTGSQELRIPGLPVTGVIEGQTSGLRKRVEGLLSEPAAEQGSE